jgi:hypothetical protein
MRRLLLCAALLVAGAPAPAWAESRVIAIGEPGPVTATVPVGEGIAWAVTPFRRPYAVAYTDPTGTRVLARLPTGGLPSVSLTLQAVDGQLGVMRTEPVCLDEHDCRYQLYTHVATHLLAGPAGGPLVQVGGCTPAIACARACNWSHAPGLAVGGGALAVVYPCARTATITEADGTTRRLTGVQQIALAGPWVAIVESPAPEPGVVGDPPSTVLIRRSDWVEVARVPRSYNVQLQADGTFAASRSDTTQSHVIVAGPPEWAPRALEPVDPVEWQGRLAGGRLLLLRSVVGGMVATVRAVDGHVLVQRRIRGPSEIAVGFDGHRITWPDQPCATTSLVVWDIDASSEPPRFNRRCGAAEIVGRTARLRRSGIALRLACPARPEQGCRGRLRIIGPGAERWAHESVTLSAGRTALRGVTLAGYARRMIRRSGRARATVVFEARGGSWTRRRMLVRSA